MRLIGNKTRLLPEIEAFLRDRGILGGTLLDIFSGTAAVGRHFKALGFRVISNDHLAMCHAKAVADVEVGKAPPFKGLRERFRDILSSDTFRNTFSFQADSILSLESRPLAEAIHLLQGFVEPTEGLIFRNYSPGGAAGRMYFSDDNGRKIDGILLMLREGQRSGFLNRSEFYLLLSSLLDAADRVANISGTYGAFLKNWQRNARQPLSLQVPAIYPSSKKNEAHNEDANTLIRKIKGDILYVDPPYNHRQYAANYHVLQVIAEHSTIDNFAAYEQALYGKTGLRPYDDLRSSFCVPPGDEPTPADAYGAMRDLILNARVEHVLVSYNEEGILTREELGGILARFSGKRSFDYDAGLRNISYKRFCSDSDRPEGDCTRGRRVYKILEGKGRGETSEWLLLASGARSRSRARTRKTASPLPG